MSSPLFGRAFRAKHFDCDPEFISLNHGSYGLTPKSVHAARLVELDAWRQCPERYIRRMAKPRLLEAIATLTPYFNIGMEQALSANFTFVERATLAVAIVLESLDLKAGDTIIKLNTTFEGCADEIGYTCDNTDIKVVEISCSHSTSLSEIARLYSQAIEKAAATSSKVLVFVDVVSSQPGLKLPWQEVVAQCQPKPNVYCFVDGSHGLGLVDLDLAAAQPDFFVTILHKWFFCPPGSALFYTDERHHALLHNVPHTHYTQLKHCASPEKTLQDKFLVPGHVDYSRYISAKAAAEFRQQVCGGEQVIREYMYGLAQKGADVFVEKLNAERMVKDNTRDTAMVNVYLPVPQAVLDGTMDLKTAATKLQDILLDEYNVFFTIMVDGEKLFARLSAQLYLEVQDFIDGAAAYQQALRRI